MKIETEEEAVLAKSRTSRTNIVIEMSYCPTYELICFRAKSGKSREKSMRQVKSGEKFAFLSRQSYLTTKVPEGK